MPAPRLIPVGAEPPPLRAVGNSSSPSEAERRAKQSSKSRTTTGKTKGNRFGVLNAFVDATVRDLDRAEIVAWLLLYRDTKPNGLARTAQADLARRAGTTTRTVERAIGRLCRRGLLSVVVRGGLNKGPSTYRVTPLMRLPTPASG